MKNLLLVFILISVCVSILSLNQWEQPTLIRQGVDLNGNNASVTMPDGIVTVWSDYRNGFCQLYAQYQSDSGQLLWNPQGVLVDTGQYQHGEQMIYKADDNSVIIVWTEFELCYEFPQTVRYRAQKLNLNGEILWDEMGINLLEFSAYQNDLVFFSDLEGGLIYILKNYESMTRSLIRINNEGLLLDPISLNVPFAFSDWPYDKILDLTYSSENGLNIAYTFDRKLSIANFDLNGTQFWNTVIDSSYSVNYYKVKLNQQADSSLTCFFFNRNTTNDKTIKGQKLNQSGIRLWGNSPKTIYTDNFAFNYMQVKNYNNFNYIVFSSDYLKVINTDSNGDLIWENPIILENNLVNPNYISSINFDLVIRDSNNIYLFWLRYANENYSSTRVMGQKLNSVGSKQWGQEGRNFTQLIPGTYYLKINEVNNNIVLVWDNALGSHLSQIINNNDQILSPNEGFIIYYGINGDINDHRVIPVNQNAFVIWNDRRKANNKSDIYYQIVDQEGEVLLENNGKNLTDNDEINIILDVKTDNEKNVIVWLATSDNGKFIYRIQKIDPDGFCLFPEEGIVVFDSTFNVIMNNKYEMNIIDDEIYLYLEASDYYNYCNIIVGQRIYNDQVMWGSSGRVIIDKADGSEFSNSNILTNMFLTGINANLIAWHETAFEPYPSFNVQKRIMLLKLNNEGQAESNWNSQGNPVFINNRDSYKNFFVFEVPEGFLCIAGKEVYQSNQYFNQYHYQIISQNGELVYENEISLNAYPQIDIKKIDWNGYILTVFWNETNAYNYLNYIQKFTYYNLELTALHTNPILLSTPSIAIEMFNNRVMTLIKEGISLNVLMYDENGTPLGSPYSVIQNNLEFINENNLTKIDNQYYFVSWEDISFNNSFSTGSSLHIQKASTSSFTTNDIVEYNTPFITVYQNYPNPFNPNTTISFDLKSEQHIELCIYNIKGQKVKTLINEKMQTGKHQIKWDGLNNSNKAIASGIYFYNIKAGNQTFSKKMLMLK